MHRNIFVTGTDTDVGKTVVATILACGLNASYWKPIQSGIEDGTDSNFVEKFIEKKRIYKESYRLTQPLSPNHAAEIDGISIDSSKINLPSLEEKLIIEGAGGILVPINEHQFIVDLIKKFQFGCVVVARSELGTLNHTLLTLSELKRRAIPVIGVVLNGPKNALNKESIIKFGDVKIIAEIERIKEFSYKQFVQIFNNNFNKDLLCKNL